jgi:serine/threonine-protein kinase
MTTRIDRYEILETLYHAGSLEVFLAQEDETGRRVTLETLPADAFPSRRRSEIWLNQVRALRAFRHPNLLAVVDADRSGRFYIAREWIPGQTLASLLDAGWSFDAVQAAQIGAAVAEGLAYLHRNGRLHGAVNPENVILGTEGEIRLGGLGSMLHYGGRYYEEYTAPEVKEGLTPGRRSDLYGLGVILRHLYDGSEPWCPSGRPGSGRSAMPDPFGALIHTLLAEDPTQRPRSAGVVAETLQAMVRRAMPELGPDPEDGEVIDLSPEMLVAIPHYIASPAPLPPLPQVVAGLGSLVSGRTRDRSGPETADPRRETAARGVPAVARPAKAMPAMPKLPDLAILSRMPRTPTLVGSGAMLGALVLVGAGWPMLGGKPKSAPAAKPAAGVKTPAAAPAAAPVSTSPRDVEAPNDDLAKLRTVLRSWSDSWQQSGWDLHVAHYANPVEKFYGLKRTRRQIGRLRRLEVKQRGDVRLKTLTTSIGADGSGRAQVQAEWDDSARKLTLQLRRLNGNWRIVSETGGPASPNAMASAADDGAQLVSR